ncbi:DinI-like family protein, partial [Escherichia coli]
MRINITLDKEQKLGQQIIDAFQNEITHRVQCVFPATKVNVKKGSMTSVEAIGFDKE